LPGPIGWAAIAAVVTLALLLTYAVRGRSATLLASSIWKGPRDRAAVALTFDDGPSESTPLLLEILARFGVRATFFVNGANVSRLPEIARQIQRAGHEIGNHGQSHPYYYFRSAAFIRDDLSAAQRTIAEVTGVEPRFFRAPYGVRWFGLGAAQASLGLMGVMWTIIGQDWKRPAGAVVERVMKNIRNGAIICLHDGRTTTANPDIRATLDAVSSLVPQLQSRGYNFVTVSELTR